MKHVTAQSLRLALPLLTLVLGSTLISPVKADEPPPDATCLDCHSDYDKTLVGSPHRLASTVAAPAVKIGCISCHAGWERHLEDPDKGNISNPNLLTGQNAVSACSECHTPHRNLDNYGFDVHTELQTNCTSCHKVHGNNQRLLIDADAAFCWRCHETNKTAFAKRSAHPIKQGNVTCLSCHQFTRKVDQDISYGLGNVCRDCHPDKGGPNMYEHEPVVAYSDDGRGCTECHNPHGSENDMLLKQPANRLCSSCHATPAKHATAHEAAFVGIDCLTCHGQIHGSSTKPALLNDDLDVTFGSNCWVCHKVN